MHLLIQSDIQLLISITTKGDREARNKIGGVGDRERVGKLCVGEAVALRDNLKYCTRLEEEDARTVEQFKVSRGSLNTALTHHLLIFC